MSHYPIQKTAQRMIIDQPKYPTEPSVMRKSGKAESSNGITNSTSNGKYRITRYGQQILQPRQLCKWSSKEIPMDGTTLYPDQGNSSYIFPWSRSWCDMYWLDLKFPKKYFWTSAERLAELVMEEDSTKGNLHQPLSTITRCSIDIAAKNHGFRLPKTI